MLRSQSVSQSQCFQCVCNEMRHIQGCTEDFSFTLTSHKLDAVSQDVMFISCYKKTIRYLQTCSQASKFFWSPCVFSWVLTFTVLVWVLTRHVTRQVPIPSVKQTLKLYFFSVLIDYHCNPKCCSTHDCRVFRSALCWLGVADCPL